MSDEKKKPGEGEGEGKENESGFQPKGEVKQKTEYGKHEHEVEYEKEKGGKWEKTKDETTDEEKKTKTTKEVTVYKKDLFEAKGYGGPDAKAKGKTEHASGEASAGLLYGKVEGKSKLSFDLDKKEADLTVFKGEAKGSLAHADAKGEFDIGGWFRDLFAAKPKGGAAGGKGGASPGGGGGGGPMAARVGDPTGHGTPLAPGIGSPNVLIGGMPAWRALADFHMCPIVKGLIPDVGGMALVGSPTVLINNMMACRVGDMIVEIPGGPNPIAMGCPTVHIGSAGGGGGGGGAKKGTCFKASGEAEGNVGTAEAEAEASVKVNKDEQEATLKAGAMVAAAKGSVQGSLTIPLWGDHSLTLGGSAEGTLGSLGAEGEFSAGHSKEKGWHLKAGGKAGAVLGGVGLGFSIGFK